MRTALLEIEGVFTAYDKADVLQGVSLKSIRPHHLSAWFNGSERPHWYARFSG
jgi:hypothetical protein